MSEQQLWRDVVALATKAPSVRNVQPWRFTLSDDGLERAIHRLAGRVSHRVHAHDVLIRGECTRCAGSRSTPAR